MTLPNERTRALINAADFLTRLVSPYNPGGIKKIPKAVRNEALRILKHFPRPYDLHAAAKACPEVFDEQEILRYDEERQPPDPAPAPVPPDTSWMDADELIVDPPSGWRYGFPKVWNRKTHPDMKAWLVENGDPEKAANSNNQICRFMAIVQQEDGSAVR